MLSLLQQYQHSATTSAKASTILIIEMKPHATLKPYPNPYNANTQNNKSNSSVEMNSTSYDKINNYLYGAAGDVFGCYQYDLGTSQLIRTLNHCHSANVSADSNNSSNNQLDYLHVVKVVDTGKVATAGESGAMVCFLISIF